MLMPVHLLPLHCCFLHMTSHAAAAHWSGASLSKSDSHGPAGSQEAMALVWTWLQQASAAT